MWEEQRMLRATFMACVAVLAVDLVTAIANWRMYFSRVELVALVEQLQQRVVALQERELDRQQYKMPPLQPQTPQTKE